MGDYGGVLGVPDVQPFTVRTDNNPLTYIMMTPNLDAMGHQWVNALVGFDFKIEYLKGTDNKVTDVLSRVETRLDNATTKELLVDCPNTVLNGAGYTSMNEDPEAWTKVQKQAVNEVIKRAKFLQSRGQESSDHCQMSV